VNENMDVFLDIGFTLLGGPSLSPPKKIRAVLDLPENSYDILSEIVFAENHSDPDSLIDSVGKKFDIGVTKDQRDEISDFWDSQYEDVYELGYATELFQGLFEMGHKVHIISNLWFPFYRKFNEVFEEFIPKLSSQTFSFKDGLRKPSMKLYENALERSCANPKNSVMVGDSAGNDMVPAASLGMKGIWYLSRELADDKLAKKRQSVSNYCDIYEVKSLKEALELIKKGL
jgi:FMN phosphatase YigB (HAD superfamily)